MISPISLKDKSPNNLIYKISRNGSGHKCSFFINSIRPIDCSASSSADFFHNRQDRDCHPDFSFRVTVPMYYVLCNYYILFSIFPQHNLFSIFINRYNLIYLFKFHTVSHLIRRKWLIIQKCCSKSS